MGKRIKILFTIPNFDTAGSGKSVYDMVSGLDKTVFNPEVCCFHDKGELFEEMEKLNVKIHVFKFARPYRPFFSLPFRILKIARFFKQHQFDLIHSWHWSSDITEPLAAKIAGIPYVYTKKAMGWGNKAWRWKSRLSTKIVSVNEEIPESFFHNMLDKVKIIPLCVDVRRFSPLHKSYSTPQGIKFDKNDFVIVSVANLAPVKGIEILIEAVLKLEDENIKVLIVGDDNNDYGEKLHRDYGGLENIYFLGKHLDVRPFLALADIFIIPTKDEGRREGLPIAPMEAMACQRIVLGSSITGIREVLKEFPDCLFEPGNIKDLMGKINEIKNMPISTRVILANAMRHYVENNLNIDVFIKEHEVLYKKLLKL
ncbi:glycosyltransferase [Snuella sedimenti]|uniref:Glycosyltransferase n=1 Tax=Snuella sedimenti TaxID=2798802 RepID=A0A8J7ITV3_9FLAO|nr:glycosyltransferase [Snuella sedimenti]MBJ6367910.1 glycosyltransferase [Snuella sedimenti]